LKKFLKVLAVLTVLSMTFVVIGGVLVTNTGSADGCGQSWPLCDGKLVKLSDVTPQKLIEFAHRATTFIGTIFVFTLAILASIFIKERPETRPLAITAVLFLIIQALMGAAAVIWGQNPYVLALHFGISLISYAAVVLLALLVFEVDKKFDARHLVIDKKMRINLYALSIYTYIVVYSGALVRRVGAELSLPPFPFRNGTLIFPHTKGEFVQLGHRSLALLLVIWIGYITYVTWKEYRQYRVMKYSMIISMILVLSQATTGILIVVTQMNLYVILAHSLIITLLFSVFSYLMLLASRSQHSAKNSKEYTKSEQIL